MTASDNTIQQRYIAHGLALIRASNGMTADVDAVLIKLTRDIRYALSQADLSDIGRRDLNALLSDIDDAIFQRYNQALDQQSADLQSLIPIEAKFAEKAGDYNNTPSPTSLAGVFSGLLILGSSLKDLWRKAAADLSYKVSAAIKSATRVAEPQKTAMASIFGQSRAVGGIVGQARQQAAAIVQTAAQAASQDARLAAFKANGVSYIEWHAILDAKVCPVCAMRAGKLYTLDGEPVGHDVPYIPIPVHPWDRCILLPHSGEAPADGGRNVMQFEQWLRSLSAEQEDELLGAGRADLFRRGVITVSDLINQNGRLLSLADLKATL